jgi:hypothetical protein
MEQMAPLNRLFALIEPVHPSVENGRRRYTPDAMLRVDLIQNWFGYSDPGMEEALYQVTPLRRFVGFSLSRGRLPTKVSAWRSRSPGCTPSRIRRRQKLIFTALYSFQRPTVHPDDRFQQAAVANAPASGRNRAPVMW